MDGAPRVTSPAGSYVRPATAKMPALSFSPRTVTSAKPLPRSSPLPRATTAGGAASLEAPILRSTAPATTMAATSAVGARITPFFAPSPRLSELSPIRMNRGNVEPAAKQDDLFAKISSMLRDQEKRVTSYIDTCVTGRLGENTSKQQTGSDVQAMQQFVQQALAQQQQQQHQQQQAMQQVVLQALAQQQQEQQQEQQQQQQQKQQKQQEQQQAMQQVVLQALAQQQQEQQQEQQQQQKHQEEKLVQQASVQLPQNMESNIIAHVSTCFQQHAQALRQVAAAQQQQEATTKEQLQILEQALRVRGVQVGQAQQQRTPAQDSQPAAADARQSPPGGRHVQLPGTEAESSTPCTPLLQSTRSIERQTNEEAHTTATPARRPSLTVEGLDMSKAPSEMPASIRNLSKASSTTRMATLFPKVEDLKCAVFESLRKQVYDVEDHYKTHGLAQAVARNEAFKTFVLFVILVNTIWIAIETDYNNADVLCQAQPVFQVVDNLFCFIFFVEIIMRFAAFEKKADALRDPWFVFDSLLVMLMVWETWIEVIWFMSFGFASGGAGARDSQVLRMFRLIRLVRVARASRIVTSFPELMLLTRGMLAGLRSVIAVLCLLMLIVYIYGVVFTMTLRNKSVGVGTFESVPQAMKSLLLQVLCGFDADWLNSLLGVHWIYFVVYLTFHLCAVLTLMNMLIGILCDVVSNVAQEAKDEVFLKEVETQISRLARELDEDGSETISKAEFDVIIKDPVMTTTLAELGVDIVGVANFATFIYEQCDDIPYNDFGLLVGQFRGTKMASVQDVMDMRRYMTMELLSFEARMRGIDDNYQ